MSQADSTIDYALIKADRLGHRLYWDEEKTDQNPGVCYTCIACGKTLYFKYTVYGFVYKGEPVEKVCEGKDV